MNERNILTRVSGYSSAKAASGQFSSLSSDVFEQAWVTKSHASDFGDLLYEITDSHLNFKHIIKTPTLNQKLRLIIEERNNFIAIKMHNLPLSNKVLLHGQAGCGKTLTAYCLAGELQKPLFIVNLGNIISSRLGETAQNLEKIFHKAKQEKAILFLDEFDVISRDRNATNEHGEIKRVVNVILQILDLLDEETIFIAATNQFDSLDKAILRRFNYIIEYKSPNLDKINEYIEFLSKSYNFKIKNQNTKKIIAKTFNGLSYSDIKTFITTFLKEKILNKRSYITDAIVISENDTKRLQQIKNNN